MSGKTPALGTLRDRVQLLRKDMTVEPEGGHQTMFVPMATVWARVHALSARQASEADGRAVRITHSVVMRYRNELQAGDRIAYRGRALEVVAANDVNGRRAYLACSCAETRLAG